ncbi:DMT family transporter [Actinorugispora endophytica]|uniref:Magnesium transporter NIPA n=1 Tax=Actinorugispora endophytica TaxID=1605990 RepID=A0A4R6UV49_9ACTN|nr:DMT family transporter [Actinorugispora endophytica]TDQ49295.1 magnesium transporter NIPA [Actinorugispora endophytica]
MVWAIVIALTGAFCLALGSALQERDAVRAPGGSVARFGFLMHLVRSPRWLAGTLAAGAGVSLHLVALSGAPLTIIQPLGVTGLLFAIVLSAVFNHRRVRVSQLLAGLAVMVGLAGVLLLFPHTSDDPVLPTSTALLLVGGVAAVGTAGYLAAHWVPAGPRAVLLATLGGAALGTTSALARVVASDTASNPMAVLTWLTPLAVAIAVFGGLLQQNAYRTGHFTAAYATLLVVDPVAGAGIGALVLGEGLPRTPLDQLLATCAALLAITGTAVLARARNRNPEATERSPSLSTTDDLVPTSGDPK